MLEAPARDSWRGMPRQTAGNLLSALGTVLVLISQPSPSATEKVFTFAERVHTFSPCATIMLHKT